MEYLLVYSLSDYPRSSIDYKIFNDIESMAEFCVKQYVHCEEQMFGDQFDILWFSCLQKMTDKEEALFDDLLIEKRELYKRKRAKKEDIKKKKDNKAKEKEEKRLFLKLKEKYGDMV
uniref:Uncharacterized protein n=1 Tax=viral metagenome TaxID=1070528 RepID=A0A6H1ZEB7_9ZZZZ